MSLLITKAAVADIAIIQAIAHKTWPATYDKILSAAQTQYMLQLFYNTEILTKQINILNQQFLLASYANKYVGFAGYELNYNNTTATRLHKIYVLPHTQGKNIGKTLIDEVLAAARSSNQSYLQLNVNIHNIAIGFYERYGFKIIGQEDIPIGNTYYMNDYIMQLAL